MIGPDFWRRYFRVYDVLNLLPSYRQLMSDLCQELGARQGDLVLDAGSGTGNLAVRIGEVSARVVALDYCPEALYRHRVKDGDCALALADLRRGLPFVDDCFDGVVSSNVLFALPAESQRYALREFRRVLKPGGTIVLANMLRGRHGLKTAANVIRDGVRADGLRATLAKMTRLMPDMVKMAYYNAKLERERSHHRFGIDEQRQLLEEEGFHLVSETRIVYSGQAALNSACK